MVYFLGASADATDASCSVAACAFDSASSSAFIKANSWRAGLPSFLSSFALSLYFLRYSLRFASDSRLRSFAVSSVSSSLAELSKSEARDEDEDVVSIDDFRRMRFTFLSTIRSNFFSCFFAARRSFCFVSFSSASFCCTLRPLFECHFPLPATALAWCCLPIFRALRKMRQNVRSRKA